MNIGCDSAILGHGDLIYVWYPDVMGVLTHVSGQSPGNKDCSETDVLYIAYHGTLAYQV